MLEAGNKPEGLKGLRVLVAEDEFAIAMFLVDYLELKGAQVVGPAGDLQALGRLLDDNPIDVALLDINLGGEQVYPLADRLAEAGTPFMLTSGYDDNLPSRFADAPRCTKPYHIEALVQQLAGLVATPQALRASPDCAACRATPKASGPLSARRACRRRCRRMRAMTAWPPVLPGTTGQARHWVRSSNGRRTCAPPST